MDKIITNKNKTPTIMNDCTNGDIWYSSVALWFVCVTSVVRISTGITPPQGFWVGITWYNMELLAGGMLVQSNHLSQTPNCTVWFEQPVKQNTAK